MDDYGFAGHDSASERDAFERELTRDEQAVTDHVTGLTRVLPEPSGPACEDRQKVGELMAMRSRLGAMAIHPPKMKLTFDDVLAAAENSPRLPEHNKVIYWITGRWGIGLVTAASVCMALLTGAIVSGDFADYEASSRKVQPSLAPESSEAPAPKTPLPNATYGSITREGSLHLLHDNPGEVQRLVTELVTSSGGHVTNLTRQGSGDEVHVEIAVAVPSEKYRDFKSKVGAFGEVFHETESTDDVTAKSVDLKARLTEAEEYLNRLDRLIETPTDLSSLQDLEQERRKTRLEIEHYRQALSALESRVAHSRLDISISEAAPVEDTRDDFEQAVDEGVDGLKDTSAFLLKSGIAGSPFLLAGALAYMGLRRKRRKLDSAA